MNPKTSTLSLKKKLLLASTKMSEETEDENVEFGLQIYRFESEYTEEELTDKSTETPNNTEHIRNTEWS